MDLISLKISINIYYEISFDISPFTSNSSIAKTIQNSLRSLISRDDYPQFTQEMSKFSVGKKLLAFIKYIL